MRIAVVFLLSIPIFYQLSFCKDLTCWHRKWAIISAKLPSALKAEIFPGTGSSTKAISKRIQVGVNFSCAPNLNCLAKTSAWPKFKLMNNWLGNWKFLSLSGLSWLKVLITFGFRDTLGFLFSWRSQSWVGWRKGFCCSRFFKFQLTLKARECRLRFWMLG